MRDVSAGLAGERLEVLPDEYLVDEYRSVEDLEREDQFVYEVTCRILAGDWFEDDDDVGERHVLPDIESLAPGLFLQVILGSVDRSKLNGYDLVRVLKARERLVSHGQAEGMADTVEMSYASPGDSESEVDRLPESFEYASDELRAALVLTRRAAGNRLDLAVDVCERLPKVFRLLSEGLIDLARARVICNGTEHLTESEARDVVDRIAERAPRLTTGQLAALIRKLCVNNDPDKAKQRVAHAKQDRRMIIERLLMGPATSTSSTSTSTSPTPKP